MNTAPLPELVLVEDNLDDEVMSLMGITRSGIPCRVTVRRDGVDALDHLLGAHEPPPALIVLDFQLPKLNGLEVLTRLRSNDRTRLIPVVMVSGTNSGNSMSECYRNGANSCVTKPLDSKEYIDRLAGIAHYWLTVNQPLEMMSL